MITHRISFRNQFAASHASPERYCDSRGHGHDWEVTVTAEGQIDPKTGMVRGTDTLWEDLQAIVRELDYRDLNQAIPATDGSIQSISAWLLDRAQAICPAVAELRLSHSGGRIAATLRRKA